MMTHHILTIASLERRRWWRRRFILMQLSLPLALVGVIYQFLSGFRAADTVPVGVTAEDMARFHLVATAFPTGVAVLALAMFMTVIAVILLTESMPLDQQLRVSTLLESLPLSPSAYILGKVLGALVVLLQLYGIALVILLGLTRLIIGPLMIKELLLLAALCSLPMVITTTLGVLLSAVVNTRRKTLAVGLGVLLLSLAQVRAEAAYPNGLIEGMALLPRYSWLNQLVMVQAEDMIGWSFTPPGSPIHWTHLVVGGGLQLLILGLLALAMIGWRRRAH